MKKIFGLCAALLMMCAVIFPAKTFAFRLLWFGADRKLALTKKALASSGKNS